MSKFKPISRDETWMQNVIDAVNKEEGKTINAITREEKFTSALIAAIKDEELPEITPKDREEELTWSLINAVKDNAGGGTPVLEDVNITPTTSEQTITAGEGYDGIGTATVEAVTSAIDANITSGNIKKDVAILGVTGDYDPPA